MFKSVNNQVLTLLRLALNIKWLGRKTSYTMWNASSTDQHVVSYRDLTQYQHRLAQRTLVLCIFLLHCFSQLDYYLLYFCTLLLCCISLPVYHIGFSLMCSELEHRLQFEEQVRTRQNNFVYLISIPLPRINSEFSSFLTLLILSFQISVNLWSPVKDSAFNNSMKLRSYKSSIFTCSDFYNKKILYFLTSYFIWFLLYVAKNTHLK